MAQVVVTMRIMPESPETNIPSIEKKAIALIAQFGGEVGKKEVVPFAFGLQALNLYFVMDESKGSTEDVEKKIMDIPGVSSVEIVDVRRTIG